jgi:wyosine [tRNA(Phe)-imidazoG37] synthetase (radical SAM superfamily)
MPPDAAAPRRLDFADHRRSLDDNRYIYAVVSRRSRGLSIGVNLNPDKVCNFDCPYCQVDRRIPGDDRPVDLDVLAAELDALLAEVGAGTLWDRPPFDTAAPALRRVNDVAFAGDGEPTAARCFAEAVEVVGACLDRAAAAHGVHGVRLHLLTNATLLHRPAVRAGVHALHRRGGEVWAKLDAGSQAWFSRVDGTRLSLDKIVENIASVAVDHPVVLQCLFPTLDGQGPDAAERAAWAGRLRTLLAAGAQLREVQVTTIARRPADPGVGPLDLPALEALADAARALGLHAVVYPGLAPEHLPAPS